MLFHHTHSLTKKTAGFQLLEIMICLSILAILASFTVAHYNAYLVKANRMQAAKALLALNLAMENYAFINNTYTGASLAALHIAPLAVDNQYVLAITALTDTDYTLTATPQAKQAINDADCGTLTLTASGTQGVSGHAPVSACW